ncbi:acetolactate synthase small subunit [Sulfurimonas sp. HSL3-7]|uniref:acetolactate synthase small subunit n=1 Tax=Sulfonitrofixus jiaomeiensis TaxID=3131938 RepID=UPI0031F89169
MQEERRVISVIVANEASALSRISGLFSARGYNVVSLTVAPIPESDYSRLTIVTVGSVRVIEQITKQLHKLIPVLRVSDTQEMIEKEMVLTKFPITEDLNNISVLANAYNGKIVNVGTDTIIVMIADEPKRVEHFLTAIRRYHPLEIVRGGTVAVDR